MKTTLAICLNHGYTKAVEVEVELKEKEFDASVTDPTFFTPVGSMIRKLNSQDKISLQVPDLYYDFPDGKDNGMELPISRQIGVDLAELSTEINKQTKKAKKRLEEDFQKAQAGQLRTDAEPKHPNADNKTSEA